MDRDLRDLERLSSRSPFDLHRYRLALVRAGRKEEAGFRWGDRVEADGETGIGVVRRVLKTRLRVWFDFDAIPGTGVIPVFRLDRRGRTKKVRLLVPHCPS